MSLIQKIKTEADDDVEVSTPPPFLETPVFVKVEPVEEDTSVDQCTLTAVKQEEKHVEPKHDITEFEVPQTPAHRANYCEPCDKCFNKASSLKNHNYMVHKKQRPFECNECAKLFESKAYLRNHLRVAHVHRDVHYCKHCHKTFMSKYYLRQHVHTAHGPELGPRKTRGPRVRPAISFECEICSKWFARRSALTVHLKTHLRSRPLHCTVCLRGFKDKYNRDRHVRKFHPYVMKHLCKICNKRFYDQAELDVHFNKNHLRAAIYECEVCTMKLTSLNNLRRHIDSHIGENSYVCDYCGHSFRNKYYLLMHIRSAHKVETASIKNNVRSLMRNSDIYICDLCDKVYHKKVTLTIHMATNHKSPTGPTNGPKAGPLGGVKSEPLDVAEIERLKDFEMERLKDAEARKINGAELINCNCDKTFKTKKEFSMHLYLMHYNELPFVCDVCSKRFLVKGAFLSHYKVLHRLERVPCRLCRRTFMNRSECEAHMESHPTVPCTLCNKLYLNKTALYKHVFYNHKKRKCDLCGDHISSVGALTSHLCKKGDIEMKFGGAPRQYGRSKVLKK